MSKEKKYRFYYSRKQDAVDEDMWGFTPRYTFVKTPDGYKQYSELCSIKGSKCNWSDAELIYETDDNPEIITHEAIPELIADLEAKLAESEKEIASLEVCLLENKNNMKEMQEFKIGEDEYDLTDEDARNDLRDYIQEFEKVSKRVYEQKEYAEKILRMSTNEATQEINQLKQQLAEKEKEIEDAKDVSRRLVRICGHSNCDYKKQTAIAELEKAKIKLNEEINNASVLLDPVEYEDYHELLGVIRGYKLSVDQIDQQIKSLKGEK